MGPFCHRALQKEFLEYGLTASYFVGKDSEHAEPAPKPSLTNLPPNELISKINYVSKLPPEQRQQMYANFQQFFELTDAEKQKTLNALSPRRTAADAQDPPGLSAPAQEPA